MREKKLNLSPSPGDEVKTTTCYMCACRCGIKVWLTDGKIRYIQGNPAHPVNQGVLCAKGAAGIMQLLAGAAQQTDAARGRTWQWRIQGNRVGRGTATRDRLAQADPRTQSR